MLSFILLSALFPLLSEQLHVRSSLCKAQAGASHWPGVDTWQRLNSSLSGVLLEPLPPAAVCYKNISQSYDSGHCEVVTESWYQSSFHGQDPVSVAYPNWQDDACLPPGLYNGNDSCRPDRFPRYVVNASSVEHVVKTVKFAAENNVRLVVKGRGHDLLGRSTAPSSLSIWTAGLRGMTYDSSFSSSCASIDKIPAITAYSGHSVGDVYDKASEYNMTFVGAADPSVGLGGYLTGGGHSPLGSEYGMASDNVLQLSLVTPTGQVLTANPCQNTDLFWAMRGGGGATFGVLINATLRAYPMPPLTFAKFAFDSTDEEAGSNQNNNFFSAVAYLHTQLPMLSKAGLSGYFSMMPLSSRGESGPMNFAFLIYALSSAPDILEKTLDPIMAHFNATAGLSTSIVGGTLPSFRLFQTSFLSAAAVGTNGLTASRLWGEDAVSNEDDLRNVLRKLSGQVLVGTFVSGEGVKKVPANQNALNPAWRRTVVHMMTSVVFPLGSTTAEMQQAARTTDDLSAVLRAQAPNTGNYVNEANVREPEYQQAFWGDHYAKLLEIKRRVDPSDVFWCPVCVGAEKWRARDDGQICKV